MNDSVDLFTDSDDNNDENITINPYIYYDINEITEFTVYKTPKNPNIKTIGIYQYKNCKNFIHNYPEFHGQSSREVELDLELLDTYPNSGDLIEIFGVLEFYQQQKILVRFYNELKYDNNENQRDFFEILREFRQKFCKLEYYNQVEQYRNELEQLNSP